MRPPLSTYRLQFTKSFTFTDARPAVDYITRLGIACIYASPIFASRPGSTHGYDVTDPNVINPELGGARALEEMNANIRDRNLCWLQDIVPNHMAYGGENRLILDVFEHGPRSQFFPFFDIDWDYPREAIRGKVLAPFLGSFYGDALENGEIRLMFDEQGLAATYYELRFPLRYESYPRVFSYRLSEMRQELGGDRPDFTEFVEILSSLRNNARGAGDLKARLWDLYRRNDTVRRFSDQTIAEFNGIKGNPESFNLLDALLGEQFYRLSFWKVASEELNYRRFFSINDLISLRAENPRVFEFTHALALRLLSEGKISALRVDHIDGLYDPYRYLKELRLRAGDRYIVVEKILAFGEDLPSEWPVQGTTGYDFLNYLNGLFCDPANAEKFDRIYTRFIGYKPHYENLVFDEKRLIIGKYMAGDVDALAQLMKTYSDRTRRGRDITMYGLKRALVDVLALFPIYRTYISDEAYTERDRLVMKAVMKHARETNPGLVYEFGFIEDFLLLNFREFLTEDEKRQWRHFVMRFQQYTGPLMAKGFEDTALYVYNRLISLNEVGGDPGRFGISVNDFHRFNLHRAEHWPSTMNASSTHDTKRGEDARARINVLSELPDEWRGSVRAWSRMNAGKKTEVNGRPAPVRNDEYFLYQTLIGSLPFYSQEFASFARRLKEYVIKAVREAKIYTAWLKPDEEYERAFLAFIDRVLDDDRFMAEFIKFFKKISWYAVFNSLSQMLIKTTAPGVPDFYQGSELWNFSMVDPDNRRPVDFPGLSVSLDGILRKEKIDVPSLIRELWGTKEDGRIKLFLIHRALTLRNSYPGLFLNGSYVPLETAGKFRNNIVAFARRLDEQWAVTVAPRFLSSVVKPEIFPVTTDTWGDTSVVLPGECPRLWRETVADQEIASDGTLRVGHVFSHLPAGLLFAGIPPVP